MCIYSVLINNHCPVVYHYSSQVLIFHRLLCLLAFAYIYSSVHDGKGSSWGNLTHHHWAHKICMNWSVSSLRLREMNCLWVQPSCPPTAFPSLLHLPASCFKLLVAFCSCSFICSTMDTKACREVWGGPYFYHTEREDHCAHRTMWHHPSFYIWTAILFFYSCVFTCNTHPPASGSCRAKQSVHVRIVVAIKKKKKKSQSTAFVRILCNCFHSYKLLWRYNAYMYDKKTYIRCSLSAEATCCTESLEETTIVCVVCSHSTTDLLEHQGLKYHFPWLR